MGVGVEGGLAEETPGCSAGSPLAQTRPRREAQQRPGTRTRVHSTLMPWVDGHWGDLAGTGGGGTQHWPRGQRGVASLPQVPPESPFAYLVLPAEGSGPGPACCSGLLQPTPSCQAVL